MGECLVDDSLTPVPPPARAQPLDVSTDVDVDVDGSIPGQDDVLHVSVAANISHKEMVKIETKAVKKAVKMDCASVTDPGEMCFGWFKENCARCQVPASDAHCESLLARIAKRGHQMDCDDAMK